MIEPRPPASPPTKAWVRWGLAGLWGCLVLYVGARMWGFAVDDFFITYRYAQNLCAGHGFVYNPGERVFGTTAPGVGLLLSLLHTLTRVSIPGLGTLTTAAGLWVVVWVLHRDTPRRRPETAIAGTFLLLSTFLWIHAGGEAPVVLALLTGAAAMADRSRVGAGLLAGFAVWCRPDAALGVGILGLVLWVEKRRLPWRYGVSGGSLLAVGLIAAHSWFGAFLPATLAAKRLQSAWLPEVWASGIHFWSRALRLQEMFNGPAVPWLAALGLAGHVLLLRHGGRATRVLTLYSLALMVAYPVLGVPFYAWYAIPAYVTTLFGAAFAAGAGARSAHRFLDRGWVAKATAAALVGVLVAPIALPLARHGKNLLTGPRSRPRFDLYKEVGEWMFEHVPPGEATAFVEVGTIAYFSQRPIYDLLGLVSPAALPHVAKGDMKGAFLASPTPWVLYGTKLHAFMEPVRQTEGFDRAYEERAAFGPPGDERQLILYRRREETPSP
ncbi:MAG: hypothetical protein AAF481_10285 [Acidobacteriota bacterium]